MEDRVKRSSQTLQDMQSKSNKELYQSHETYLHTINQAIEWIDRVFMLSVDSIGIGRTRKYEAHGRLD